MKKSLKKSKDVLEISAKTFQQKICMRHKSLKKSKDVPEISAKTFQQKSCMRQVTFAKIASNFAAISHSKNFNSSVKKSLEMWNRKNVLQAQTLKTHKFALIREQLMTNDDCSFDIFAHLKVTFVNLPVSVKKVKRVSIFNRNNVHWISIKLRGNQKS